WGKSTVGAGSSQRASRISAAASRVRPAASAVSARLAMTPALSNAAGDTVRLAAFSDSDLYFSTSALTCSVDGAELWAAAGSATTIASNPAKMRVMMVLTANQFSVFSVQFSVIRVRFGICRTLNTED